MPWKRYDFEKFVNQIFTGDCLKFMKRLPDSCIDFCMTSPPYWSLRDYGVKGQIGLEKNPEGYIEQLVLVFRELKRVLKDAGSFYLNLGDTYIGSACGYGQKGGGQKHRRDTSRTSRSLPVLCQWIETRGRSRSNWL